jgi:hypothetical protein
VIEDVQELALHDHADGFANGRPFGFPEEPAVGPAPGPVTGFFRCGTGFFIVASVCDSLSLLWFAGPAPVKYR